MRRASDTDTDGDTASGEERSATPRATQEDNHGAVDSTQTHQQLLAQAHLVKTKHLLVVVAAHDALSVHCTPTRARTPPVNRCWS
jgi:hypothetical protein